MSAAIRTQIFNSGARQPRAQVNDIVKGRVALYGATTDNATTVADLTASGGLRSEAIKTRLGIGLPTANPAIVLLIERIGISFHAGLEFDLLIAKYAQEMYLKHSPVSADVITIDLAGYLTSAMETNGGGVVATGAFGSQVRKAQTYALPTPLIVNMELDGLDAGPHTAVDAGAALPFTIWADCYAFSNKNYTRSEWVASYDGPDAMKQMVEEEARHNTVRAFRDGKTAAVRG